MKTLSKRILSLVIVFCMAFIGVFTTPMFKADAATSYVEITTFGAGKLLITTTYDGSTYYLPATTTSNAPNAMSFTDVSKISEDHLWTITATGNNYYIQNSEGKYLYTTSANNGVRVGDTKHAWKYDPSANSFQDTETSRFLGIYNAQDWRCYTTVDASNYQKSSTSFKFYKVEEQVVAPELDSTTKTALNKVESLMSLAYKYTQTTETETISATTTVSDKLEKPKTGATSNSYISWEYESGDSGAKYAGCSATSYSAIQLNNNSKGYGIVTTASGGKATKITVTWNSNTASGRTLNVYGNNTAYSASADLYDTAKQGKSLGTIVCGTSTELTIEGDYAYIGFTSEKNAMYLDSVEITWEKATEGGGGTQEVTKLSDSNFLLKCGVDSSLANIENVDGYGIQVKTNDKTVKYTSWTTENGVSYVVIRLGDIINDLAKLETEFTVQAYVEVDGITYTSELKKNYSVVTMIDEYYNGEETTDEVKDIVEDLYNYFVEKGLI